MVVEWIHQKYIDSGFYPGASVNDDCALSVLGVASISQAKQNMAKFTAVVKMVSDLKQWGLMSIVLSGGVHRFACKLDLVTAYAGQ